MSGKGSTDLLRRNDGLAEESMTALPVDEAHQSQEAEKEKKATTSNEDDTQYPTGLRLTFIFLSIILAVFLAALDATIIATAIPTITSQFDSLNDVAWYSAAYLLTSCAFQLPYGTAYKLLNTKWTFLSSVAIFEIGSAVCGAAPTSVALIIGRAVQGIGGAGIFGGSFIIISESVPLNKRSLFNGMLGATFGISSVVGPLLGGAFTTHVTWRWCFYINLPLGGVAVAVVFFCLPDMAKKEVASSDKKGRWATFWRFDPIGTVVLIPSVICLLLALQWGGTTYAWSSGRLIALLVCFGVSIIAWGVLQYWEGDNATVPGSVAKQRSVANATLYTFFGSAAFVAVVYFIPIWFQAIKSDSAELSGIHQLPLILSVVVFSIVAGGMTVGIGYYTPFLILGSFCMAVGSALLMFLEPETGKDKWIGYQILFGAGVGMSLEQCNIAVQTVLPQDQVSSGISLTIFARTLGGVVGISIGNNIFQQKLSTGLKSVLPNLNSGAVSGSGATNLVSNVLQITHGNQKILAEVLQKYDFAITRVFLVALVFGCVTLPFALLVEWKSVKTEKKKEQKDEEKGNAQSASEMEMQSAKT